MSPIRVRGRSGTELSFANREEFQHAAASGRITSDCEVFHGRANRWLPVTAHPAWPTVYSLKVPPAPSPRGRSADLVLIYPDQPSSKGPAETRDADSDPFESGSILAPDEIHRVLHAPRTSGPTRRVSGQQERPLLEKALPTFSRALHAAAEIMQRSYEL